MGKLERERKKYTREELVEMQEMVGMRNFLFIGTRLKRSPKAIQRKLERLRIANTKENGGFISANELCNALNVHLKVLLRWKDQFNLPLKNKNLRHGKGKYASWRITVDEFWDWAEKNKELVNWLKYEQESLGFEPDWLAKTIIEQRQNTPRKQKAFWTIREERELWELFYTKGLTQKEIAKRMERSQSSIERKIFRLRKTQKEGGKLPWE